MALTDSLVSYWKMDEASGNAIDAHGSNDLTDNNTVGTGTGILNGGRDHELTNSEYLSHADNADLSVGNIDFTWTCWVKAESLPATEADIISKYETVGDQREYRLHYRASTNRFEWTISGDGTFSVPAGYVELLADSLGAPSTATWYFIVCWYDATANTTNIQINNGTVDSAAQSAGVLNGTSPLHIGALGRAAVTFYFDGIIDEVGFWKRVLTADERTSLYNSGAGLAYPFTVGGSLARLTEGGLIAGGKLIGGRLAA